MSKPTIFCINRNVKNFQFSESKTCNIRTKMSQMEQGKARKEAICVWSKNLKKGELFEQL